VNGLGALLNHPLAHRVGWALVHSLWQGAVVAIVYSLLRVALRRYGTNIRYWTACGMLFLLTAAPIATLFVSSRSLPLNSPPTVVNRTSSVAPAMVRPAPEDEIGDGAPVLGWHAFVTLEHCLPWLVGGWAAGVLLFSCRWLRGCGWIRRVTRRQTEALEADWLERLEDLKLRLNISQPVRLFKSALVEVPMVVGWLKPVILLPMGAVTGLTPAQLEAILAHELAHIRRGDYIVNAFQNAVETLMFYHPVVWWISRCIREERELGCDELVVRVCEDRFAYARALVTLEEMRGLPAEMAFAASGGPLLRRIRRLLGVSPEDQPASAREFGGLVLMALGCVLVIAGMCLMVGTTTYAATSRLKSERDLPPQPASSGGEGTQLSSDPYFLQSELAAIRTGAVLGPVIESLQLTDKWGRRYKGSGKLSVAEVLTLLRNRLELRQIPNTAMFEIRVSDEDPAEAAALANAIASAYQRYRADQAARTKRRRARGIG
jgi:bla regulator protein BlaR1